MTTLLKKIQSSFYLFVTITLTLTSFAHANSFHLMSLNFAAPIVSDATNLPSDTRFGTIVYDNTTQHFRGLKGDGTWETFSGVGSSGSMALLSSLNDSITLPAANTLTNTNYVVKNTYSTFTTQTVSATEGQFDGDPSITSYKLSTNGETLTFFSNGTNWYLVSRSYPKTWTAYTPSFTGWGTVTNISFFWRRVGGNIEVLGKATWGTRTATEARISLPAALTSSSTSIPSIRKVGDMWITTATTVSYSVLSEPSVNYVTFAYNNGGGLTKQNGSAITFDSDTASVSFSVPIAGWEE